MGRAAGAGCKHLIFNLAHLFQPVRLETLPRDSSFGDPRQISGHPSTPPADSNCAPLIDGLRINRRGASTPRTAARLRPEIVQRMPPCNSPTYGCLPVYVKGSPCDGPLHRRVGDQGICIRAVHARQRLADQNRQLQARMNGASGRIETNQVVVRNTCDGAAVQPMPTTNHRRRPANCWNTTTPDRYRNALPVAHMTDNGEQGECRLAAC